MANGKRGSLVGAIPEAPGGEAPKGLSMNHRRHPRHAGRRLTGKPGKPKQKADKRPTIVTVEENGHERKWGPLSENNAWTAGSFWLEMGQSVKVFLEKDGLRNEVEVLKRFEKGREKVWFKEKNHQHRQHRHQDNAATQQEVDTALEEDAGMHEDTPEEIEAMNKMWLAEKVTSLEKENEGLKTKVQEMEVMIAQQVEAMNGVVAVYATIRSAFTEIAEHVQRQIVFSESTKASIAGLVPEVQKHQECFGEVVRVLENHEQHIAKNGMA